MIGGLLALATGAARGSYLGNAAAESREARGMR